MGVVDPDMDYVAVVAVAPGDAPGAEGSCEVGLVGVGAESASGVE